MKTPNKSSKSSRIIPFLLLLLPLMWITQTDTRRLRTTTAAAIIPAIRGRGSIGGSGLRVLLSFLELNEIDLRFKYFRLQDLFFAFSKMTFSIKTQTKRQQSPVQKLQQ